MIWLIITLILIGLLFLILEILVFPGQAVAGIIGLALLITGIWQTYIILGTTAGHWVLGGSLFVSVMLIIIALRSKTWNRIMLNDDIAGRVNIIDANLVKPGDTGKAISRLNPAGKAIIHDEYYEVHTKGEFIDQGTEIVVTKTSFNKIYVKKSKS